MAEKSVLNPFKALSVGAEPVDVAQALDRPPPLVDEIDDVICSQAVDGTVAEETERTGVGSAEEEEEEDGGGSLIFPRRDGGIMATVSTSGISFLRTFSATRYMARANCSAFSRPVLSMSHKYLHTHTCMHTCTHTHAQT